VADDASARRAAGFLERANLQEPDEVAYWIRKFGCTKIQLAQAVRMGILVKDIDRELTLM